LITITLTAISAQAETEKKDGPEFYNARHGKLYLTSDDPMPFGNATEFCKKHGGRLVKLHSRDELDWLQSTVANAEQLKDKTSGFWIGARPAEGEPKEWLDGSDMMSINITNKGDDQLTNGVQITATSVNLVEVPDHEKAGQMEGHALCELPPAIGLYPDVQQIKGLINYSQATIKGMDGRLNQTISKIGDVNLTELVERQQDMLWGVGNITKTVEEIKKDNKDIIEEMRQQLETFKVYIDKKNGELKEDLGKISKKQTEFQQTQTNITDAVQAINTASNITAEALMKNTPRLIEDSKFRLGRRRR